MKINEWLDENFSGTTIADYGVVYDQQGLRWGLSLSLRQRDGQVPVLTLRWTYGSQLEGTEIEASPEFLDRFAAALRDARARFSTLKPQEEAARTLLAKLARLFHYEDGDGKLIADYGDIQDAQEWRPRVSMSLGQREGRIPVLAVRSWSKISLSGGNKTGHYGGIEATPEVLEKIEAVVQDARDRFRTS